MARRISAWTSRLLVTAMILVAALAVGRQTIEWWHADPPTSSGPRLSPGPQVGDPDQAHVLQLGDSPWAILRQTVAGSEAAATKTLGDLCRQVIETARPLPGPPTDAEQRFLATLAKLSPSEKRAGQWALYRVPAGFPLLVGIRPTNGTAIRVGQEVVVSASRVVIWAIAAPSAGVGWSLYVFYPEKGAADSTTAVFQVPVPPGASQTLAIRVLGGGAVVGFRGSPSVPAWTEFYDRWFAERGWSASGWQSASNVWRAHYRAAAPDTATADVQLGGDGGGLIVVCKGVY